MTQETSKKLKDTFNTASFQVLTYPTIGKAPDGTRKLSLFSSQQEMPTLVSQLSDVFSGHDSISFWEQMKMVAGEVGNIVKYFALGLESTACKRIMLNPDLSRNVKKLVIKEMDNELEELCKKKKNSILRQTKQEELLSSCSSNIKRTSKNATPNPCIKATITAAIFRQRCPEMSAVAYWTGCMALEMLLSCHPSTVVSELKELGKDHDQELLNSKQQLEWDNEIKKGTDMLKARTPLSS
ncbi:hypothetical protein P5673_026930 [Acropora cervicornis]|uniref:Uncharacterized protein n=1 Tax=Acropora cervicornis TaxID=6130 RepID=A0AAD9PZK7_ACRCE|nr:hypothetical protein P5673_026930 [Acropora cervicornis]